MTDRQASRPRASAVRNTRLSGAPQPSAHQGRGEAKARHLDVGGPAASAQAAGTHPPTLPTDWPIVPAPASMMLVGRWV
jgi:hypothetical protein